MLDKGGISTQIATVAERQYGHITRAQLLALGLGGRGVTNRIESGKLIAVHAGVYAIGYPRPEAVARAAAAVLACGPGALLSHDSAAALWGLRARWPARPEVTTPSAHSRRGIRTHRSSTLTHRDIRRHRGIPVTSPARTLLEIAPRLSDRALARAFNDGRLSRHLRPEDLAEVLARCPTRRGAARVRALIQTGGGPTRSQFEDAFVAFTRRFGLPTPQINARVVGYEVDVVFEPQRVIIELDGYEYHRDRGSFERDRERDAATLAAGYVTVRLTWPRMTGAPEREAARLQTILHERRGGGERASQRSPLTDFFPGSDKLVRQRRSTARSRNTDFDSGDDK